MLALVLGAPRTSALDLTGGSGAAENCAKGAVSVQATAAAYVEPAPVLSIGNYGGGRYDPGSGTNIAAATGFAEASVGVGGFCVGLLDRAEFFGTASRDLLDVVVGNHFNRPFDVAHTYELQYNFQMLQAAGMRLRRAFELGSYQGIRFKLGLGLSLLDALQGRVESLHGSAIATSTDYAIGSATWLRTDSDLNPHEFNPFVGPGHPHGAGYSTDLQMRADSDFGTTLDLVVMDVVGRIYWRDDRNSLRVADNAQVRYNADFNREAFVTGVDSRIDFVQDLRTKYQLNAAQRLTGEITAFVADDCVGGYHFPSLGARLGGPERFGSTSFDTRSHAVSIGGTWSVASIGLTSNSWPPRHATALGVSAALSLRW